MWSMVVDPITVLYLRKGLSNQQKWNTGGRIETGF